MPVLETEAQQRGGVRRSPKGQGELIFDRQCLCGRARVEQVYASADEKFDHESNW